MPDRTEDSHGADQGDSHHDESDSPARIAPMPAISPDMLTGEHRSKPLSRPLAFPLTRGASISRQILGISLYSLFMALNISGGQLLGYLSDSHNNPTYASDWMALLLVFWMFIYIIPASTVLCGMLFGSWRGMFASGLSIGGGFVLTSLLNSVFPGLQTYLNERDLNLPLYLIPGTFTTLIIGLIYDFRQYENWGKSILTMLLGMTITFFGVAFIIGSNAKDDLGSLFCCFYIFLIPLSMIPTVGIELLLQNLIPARKARREARKDDREPLEFHD